MICPICKQKIKGYAAISRKDNKTQICSRCGSKEALEIFNNYMKNYMKNKQK